ncbi:MAG TPA: type VI secretion system tip protein TssI/VgrG [Nannocystis sp.]
MEESELLVARMIGGNSAVFEVDGSANQYFVLRFRGVEAVSELYEFQIEIATRFVAVDELVGAFARLRLGTASRTPREIHGLICRAEYAGEIPPRSLYRVTLVPELWRLGLRKNSRIFQNLSTPQILTTLFDETRIAYQLRLAGTYAPRDYCVQYRETDLAFVRRLMEADGIAFYFEHTADSHTLVLSDTNTGRVPIDGDPELPFRIDEQVRSEDHVRHFVLGREITSDAVAVRDYDLHASQDLDARERVSTRARHEIYDAPIGARTAAHVGTQAKIRLEAARVPAVVATGTSDCPRLVPGHCFTLTGHIRGELDGEYHILRTVHRGEQPRIVYADAQLVYDNDFVAIPTSTPYRPPRVTPRPTIRGVQTATVVGPTGEEIYVDEQGRVKVQFHWDRSSRYSEDSSCWVRVSQAWAGPGYGAMFIPRIGHEVLVEFIEGDPDRPIITGRIYDGTRTPPYPLPDEKTKSTIKTDSSPGGGGFNELRFEDAKDREEIFIHAQRDKNTVVLRDDTHDIRRHHTTVVGGDQITTVHANQATTVTGGRDIVVGGDQTTSVHGHILSVAAMDHATAVGGDQHLQVQGFQKVEVGLSQQVTVLGDCSWLVGMMVDAIIGTDTIVNIGGNCSLTIGATRTTSIAGTDTLSVGGAITTTAGGAVTITAPMITLVGGGSMIALYPGGIDIACPGIISINGALVTVNMGV